MRTATEGAYIYGSYVSPTGPGCLTWGLSPVNGPDNYYFFFLFAARQTVRPSGD